MGFVGSFLAGLIRGFLSPFFAWLEKRRERQQIEEKMRLDAQVKELEKALEAQKWKDDNPPDLGGDPYGDFRMQSGKRKD